MLSGLYRFKCLCLMMWLTNCSLAFADNSILLDWEFFAPETSKTTEESSPNQTVLPQQPATPATPAQPKAPTLKTWEPISVQYPFTDIDPTTCCARANRATREASIEACEKLGRKPLKSGPVAFIPSKKVAKKYGHCLVYFKTPLETGYMYHCETKSMTQCQTNIEITTPQ